MQYSKKQIFGYLKANFSFDGIEAKKDLIHIILGK